MNFPTINEFKVLRLVSSNHVCHVHGSYLFGYLVIPSFSLILIFGKHRPWWMLPKKLELMLFLMDALGKEMIRYVRTL